MLYEHCQKNEFGYEVIVAIVCPLPQWRIMLERRVNQADVFLRCLNSHLMACFAGKERSRKERNSKKRSMHYNVDVIKVAKKGKAGPCDPKSLAKVVGVRLAKTEMRWEIVPPFTELSVEIRQCLFNILEGHAFLFDRKQLIVNTSSWYEIPASILFELCEKGVREQ
jgi:hypothetical protein